MNKEEKVETLARQQIQIKAARRTEYMKVHAGSLIFLYKFLHVPVYTRDHLFGKYYLFLRWPCIAILIEKLPYHGTLQCNTGGWLF